MPYSAGDVLLFVVGAIVAWIVWRLGAAVFSGPASRMYDAHVTRSMRKAKKRAGEDGKHWIV